MQEEIHPNYHEIAVTCSCGNKFVTRSTYSEDAIRLDVCDQCHPFYSGKQKIVDTAGRVEKFNKKFNRTSFSKKKEETNSENDKA